MFVNELFPILSASISNTAKIVFISYAGHANSDGMTWPATRRICELTGFRSSTVRHARSELVRAGFLESTGGCVFRVVLPSIADNHPEHPIEMVAHATAPVVAKNATAAVPEPERPPAPAPAQAELLSPAKQLPATGELVGNSETLQPDEQPATEKITDGQNADAARDAAVRDGYYPSVEKTNSPEPVPAATPQHGELLPAEPKTERTKRATRLPDDWQLPRAWGVWAMQEMGMAEDSVRWEADKFADYWHARSGQGATKISWLATWRNWIRKNAESGGTASGAPRQKSKTRMAMERLIAMSGGDFEIPF